VIRPHSPLLRELFRTLLVLTGIALVAVRVAAAVLLVSGLGAIVFEQARGARANVSGGIVTLALAAWFSLSLYRALPQR
jgi:hypothetical protein